ncbi:NAD(P)/FAD-dependent oxidoreductase [Bryobacter aggregatus]|uniref:NAD(P)/FAD-dependent oxidoreductase n=1 Tax=Bryobacter aggregatus TaxID=360054 RepID=UPI0004E19FF7|nr:NAD(P)/FAD-dependent oxidoreductase [Bryobacter aggregatus]
MIAIVGAGLAGLACGLELARHKIPFVIHEASDGPGGRVRTDHVDGFLLDRGFQVYFTAYPEGQRVLDYETLDFGKFAPGALVRLNGKFHKVMDPWRETFAALNGIFNPVGTFSDKLRVGRLRRSTLSGSPDDLLDRSESTSMKALLDFGFSKPMIERFFRPLFGCIMLDTQLRVSSRMLEYMFRMMATGDTVLPAGGMGAIPAQLAANLPPASIRYNSKVAAVAARKLTLESGETVNADAVVVATEGPEAARLLPLVPPMQSRKMMTLYFKIEGEAPITEPLITLNGNLEWPIQSLCIPSVVNRSYAPAGCHLLSVSILGEPKQDQSHILAIARTQMSRWFGHEAKTWELLRIYQLQHGHPILNPSTIEEKPVRLENGVYICGDHRYFPSMQAALINGRHAAEAVVRDGK